MEEDQPTTIDQCGNASDRRGNSASLGTHSLHPHGRPNRRDHGNPVGPPSLSLHKATDSTRPTVGWPSMTIRAPRKGEFCQHETNAVYFYLLHSFTSRLAEDSILKSKRRQNSGGPQISSQSPPPSRVRRVARHWVTLLSQTINCSLVFDEKWKESESGKRSVQEQADRSMISLAFGSTRTITRWPKSTIGVSSRNRTLILVSCGRTFDELALTKGIGQFVLCGHLRIYIWHRGTQPPETMFPLSRNGPALPAR